VGKTRASKKEIEKRLILKKLNERIEILKKAKSTYQTRMMLNISIKNRDKLKNLKDREEILAFTEKLKLILEKEIM
jgi:hypothetical protein